MNNLSSANTDWDKLRFDESSGKTVENIPVDVPKIKVKVFYESHIFNCIRYDDPSDKGFTQNLLDFLLELVNNKQIEDPAIKTVANVLMRNCLDHQIIKYSDEDVAKILEAKKDDKDKEDILLQKNI